MQPLYSVDHETRNSCRRDEEEAQDSPSLHEDTPLLHRFPASRSQDRNPLTTAIASSLLAVLLLGVIIGIYLLIVQSNAENVLPPVETPLQLVSLAQWDPSAVSRVRGSPLQASQVVVVQTDSEECHSASACSALLIHLQRNITSPYRQLPYNFLVSSNGLTYESLGWHQPSPMFPQCSDALVLAFIGNFTEIAPSQQQMDEASNFFAESVSQRHLTPSFGVVGKNSSYHPRALFAALEAAPRWSHS